MRYKIYRGIDHWQNIFLSQYNLTFFLFSCFNRDAGFHRKPEVASSRLFGCLCFKLFKIEIYRWPIIPYVFARKKFKI